MVEDNNHIDETVLNTPTENTGLSTDVVEDNFIKTEGPSNSLDETASEIDNTIATSKTTESVVAPFFKGLIIFGCIVLCILAIGLKFFPSFFKNTETKKPTENTPTINFVSTTDEYQTPTNLDQLSNVSQIAYKTLPSMVSVSVLNTPHTIDYNKTIQANDWDNKTEVVSNASGIIIGNNDKELLILTNAHVITEAKSIVITFCDNTRTLCYVKGTDEKQDVAILAVKYSDISETTSSKICAIPIGSSSNVVLGEGIITIGNALGNGQSITTGIISGINRKVTLQENYTVDMLQIDAAINPGNSGGALLNANGELIGVPTAKSNVPNTEGMGFAIPIDNIKEQIMSISTNASRMYATDENAVTLGINIEETSKGVMVTNILLDSIAFNSDLQVGDVIKSINDKEVNSSQFLVFAMRYFHKGENIQLVVQRPANKEYKTITVDIILK